MDLHYIKRVQEWVEIDNKLLKNKEEVKEFIERKKELEEDIIKYVENSKLDNLCLTITDGTIKFAKKSQTQGLSMRIIKLILEKYNIDKSVINIDEVCEYISSNLEKKNQIYMKRDIKDNI